MTRDALKVGKSLSNAIAVHKVSLLRLILPFLFFFFLLDAGLLTACRNIPSSRPASGSVFAAF